MFHSFYFQPPVYIKNNCKDIDGRVTLIKYFNEVNDVMSDD